MGSVGFAMPLLSTLAALVIIVHSAEEEYEREYHMMRPRALDTETNYEQPWRLAEMRPTITQSPQSSGSWDETDPEMTMRRRRVRKRKRRPQPSEEDDFVPQERIYSHNEEPQVHPQENIERPRRRRKKMDFQNTNDKETQTDLNEEANRPKKRRGRKRKRPLANSWPELSEFGIYQEAYDGTEQPTLHKEKQTDSVHDEKYDNQKDINEKAYFKVQIHNENEPEIEKTIQPPVVANIDDRSLSEFSLESMTPNKTTIEENKIIDKGIILSNNMKLPKETASLDPLTLKALLKKSNGKSLSEILQQNNLSLSDLLRGREKALSILKKESVIPQDIGQSRHSNKVYYSQINSIQNTEIINNKKEINESEMEENRGAETETTTLITTTDQITEDYKDNSYNNNFFKYNQEENYADENHRSNNLRRRFPGGIRRKLRTRPNVNDAFKSQLSRDLIALTSMKYRNNRNLSKSREWKDIIPSMMKVESSSADNVQTETETEITTTPCSYTETTTQEEYESTTDAFYTSIDTEPSTDVEDQPEDTTETKTTYIELEGLDIAQFTTTPLDVNTEQEKETTTFTPRPLSIVKSINATDWRRQTLNNRLKRKRGKHRTSTTEIPNIPESKDNFSNGKYLSASEFNTKTQMRTTNTAEEEDFTTLEDFLTTEASQHVPSRYQYKKLTNAKNVPDFTINKAFVTERTAKIEIDEILNDNHSSAKLSRILKERNMTLKELLEHRERGSSHVHLADIFHNASREPNPEPEPFLSKSLIEPISRETYPLRALLDANIHDPRTTTVDPSVLQINKETIPVVMDFGNNVNENSENKGIMSFIKSNTAGFNSNNKSAVVNYDKKDVKLNFNTPEIGTARGSRFLKSETDSVTWNDVINIIKKNDQEENTEKDNSLENDLPILDTLKKIDLEEDIDGDGVIVLGDLQQLRNMARKTSLESNLNERNNKQTANESITVLSDTKSVTVATASIIGLALILFLLTYAILKWKQQNKIFHTKRAKEDEFVPSPVFESRKGHKINSSIRSKSPMLATSNIYSIDTIDTRAGSESPEYMWDTLRKPFQ
ncbi:dual specificity protein kinase splB [Bicyclus anynana]|uniref:Dual specificity protein kinase splB n=1 Tax=Bicyclus anynana TaxID=110368 RepID=A0ABM3LSJ7_BICAN|nr:dual specificity protein kinase splB [Bicyclus anynana]